MSAAPLDGSAAPSGPASGVGAPLYAAAMADDITPADLERDLGVDQRRIRHYLRLQYGNLPAYTDNWHLNRRAAADVRAHFRAEARLAGGPTSVARHRSETGSVPLLFQDAAGSTTTDEHGNLRYLPSPEEERAFAE